MPAAISSVWDRSFTVPARILRSSCSPLGTASVHHQDLCPVAAPTSISISRAATADYPAQRATVGCFFISTGYHPSAARFATTFQARLSSVEPNHKRQ